MSSKNRLVLTLSIITSMLLLLSVLQFQFAFGFSIGDADPLLNNIWIEPKNPKPGDTVSIHSAIYNIGTQSTKSVTDVVTIGYLIDGKLVKIDQLVDVLPGMENGIVISTGPVWEATDGKHTITVILNYHDTLSHLTDNLQNNIMQKVFLIGDWQKTSQSLISFDLFQEYIPETQKQQIKIKGKVVLPENLSPSQKPRVNLEIENVQSYGLSVDKKTGTFFFKETFPVFTKSIPITVYFDNDRYKDNINYDYNYTANLFPWKLSHGESILSLKLENISSNGYNFKENKFTVVVYDNAYKVIKKIETTNIADYTTIVDPDLFFTNITGNAKYIIEVYYEGRLFYATQKYFEENSIIKEKIVIPESGKVRFEVFDSNNNPISDTHIKLWMFDKKTNSNGITDWIELLPTMYSSSEPYAGKVTLPDGRVFWSELFTVESGETKTIRIVEEYVK